MVLLLKGVCPWVSLPLFASPLDLARREAGTERVARLPMPYMQTQQGGNAIFLRRTEFSLRFFCCLELMR